LRRTTLFLAATAAAIGVMLVSDGSAQRQRASPHELVSARVGAAEITVTYGRPYKRGREIFGGLVPYGRVWCPGADEATTLDSSLALQFEGLTVPPGPHTIWMLPTADAWTLIVSSEPSGFHTRYHPRADLGRVALAKRQVDAPIEQLTFAIRADASGGGTLAMMWDTTEVSAPFTVVQ
jgi:hypothetical protein